MFGKTAAWSTGLALAAMVAYIVMILMWFLVYYKSFSWTVLVFVLLLVASVIMVISSQKNVTGIERRWLFWLGVLFGQSAVIGLIVGFFLYFSNLVYYWRYQDLRTYTNVAASQQAYAFNDGGMLLWTEDTRIDVMRSVGYKSRWDGETYCVAPIVDSTMTSANPINYYAVGMNCCNARAQFECDEASDLTTRSALVILEPDDIVRPYMQWAVAGATFPRYENAIRLQESTYFTRASQQGLKFVRWTKDPIALKDSFYEAARKWCIIASLIYFFVLVCESAVLAIYRIIPERKAQTIQREIRQDQGSPVPIEM